MLWTKNDDYWKLISYDVEPEFEKARSPDLRADAPAETTLEHVKGDSEMIKAAAQFMKDWFVRGNIDNALQYGSPKCYDCVNLYRPDDQPAPKSNEEARKMLQESMKHLADTAGHPKNLNAAIVAPSPYHPDLKLVKHSDEKSFVIVSIPDEMAAMSECSKRRRGEEIDASKYPTGKKTYGNYYATGFSLARGTEDAPVFWSVWTREGGQWRIVSYVILTS